MDVTIEYQGKIPSLNDIYGSKHWKTRYNASQKYHLIFDTLFKKAKLKKHKGQFKISILYNSRHDVDNIVGVEKYFTDALVEGKYVVKDDKRYFRGLKIDPEETLPKNTVRFTIHYLNANN